MKSSYLNKYFSIFSNCMFVRGVVRSSICDTQRSRVDIIPNNLYDVIMDSKGLTLQQVLDKYGEGNRDIILEYFDFLSENEYVFFVDHAKDLESFIPLEDVWDSPHLIENAILDYLDMNSSFVKSIHELNNCGCQALEIRVKKQIDEEEVISILQGFDNTRIEFITLHMPYISFDRTIFKDYQRLCFVILFSAPNGIMSDERVFVSTDDLSENSCCGNIDPKLFHPDVVSFFESKKFNSCLNRKVSIDIAGNVRNCPSLPQIHGNICRDSLNEIILRGRFKEIWSISKDQIDTCQVCEFRYVCSDCRAYLENPNDIFSKPLKCGYDPYKGKWEDWAEDNNKIQIFEKFYQL